MAITAESIVIDVIVDSVGAENSLKKLTDTFKKIGGSTSSANSGMDKTAKTMNKLSLGAGAAASGLEKISKTLLSVATVKLVANALGDCITKANEYVESYNLFTVAMGSYANEAETYAERVSDALGIDTAEWERAQGTIMTLVTGFGSVESRAYTMSKNLTQLGYDLSSFFNISVKDAMAKIESGIAGELEPLRRLGYDLSQAKLEAVAASLGINKLVSEMTQAEKAELRYYAIMTQVTKAQGDMARTIDSPANQLRVLKAQFEMLGRAIGSVFIPMLNKVLPPLIAVVRVVREIVENLAKLLGYEMPKVDYDSANKYSDSIDDSTQSVKDLKRELMGFDEINKLGKDSSAIDDSALNGAGFSFELPEYDFLGGLIETNIDRIKNKIIGILPYLDEVAIVVGFIAALVGAVKFAAWAVAAWQVASAFVVANASVVTIATAIALAVAGAFLLVDAIWKWAEAGVMTDDVFTELVGAIGLLGIAGTLAFGPIPGIIALIAIAILGVIKYVDTCLKQGDSVAKIIAKITGAIAVLGAVIAVISSVIFFKTNATIALIVAVVAIAGTLIMGLISGLSALWDKFGNKVKAFFMNLKNIKDILSGKVTWSEAYQKVLLEVEAKDEEKTEARKGDTSWTSSADLGAKGLSGRLNDLFKSTNLFEGVDTSGITDGLGGGSDLADIQEQLEEIKSSNEADTTDIKASMDSYKQTLEEAKSSSASSFVSPTATSSIAGNTTVSNLSSEEVETAVERGTYAGYSRALKENGSQPIQVTAQLNGRTLFEEVVNQNRTASKRYGKSPLSI